MIIVSKDHQELVSFRSLWCPLANVLDPQDPTCKWILFLEEQDPHQLVVRVKFSQPLTPSFSSTQRVIHPGMHAPSTFSFCEPLAPNAKPY